MEFFGGRDDGAGAGDVAEFGEEGGVHCRREKDSTAVLQREGGRLLDEESHSDLPKLPSADIRTARASSWISHRTRIIPPILLFS